jgi:hypothetical protein
MTTLHPRSHAPRPAHLALPLAVAGLLAFVATWAGQARGDPLFGWGENALEDRYVDGDLDEEDHVALRLGSYAGATDVHGRSWVSLVGFAKELRSGRSDVGGILVVGLALDRMAEGPIHRISDPVPRSPGPAPTAPSPSPPAPTSQSPPSPPQSRPAAPAAPLQIVAPSFARACVAAALRASGLGVDDARIDSLVSRARASALLPETRMRAMRLWNDAAHTTTLASTDTANFYDAVGANLVLELRLTWRLDRALYAGDEPSLERVRLERQDARSRVATHTLEVLFAWQRARAAVTEAIAGSRDALESRLRLAEAQATLDVLTAGWFSSRNSGADAGDAETDP